MSDSPRCFKCIADGKTGQTYKVFPARVYKCQSCQSIYTEKEFKPLDFEWKTKPEEWQVSIRQKLEAQKNKVGIARLNDILEKETPKK